MAADPDADLSTPVVGPIPPDRHKKILERTREKVAAETKATFEREHGPWLQLKAQFTPDEFSSMVPRLKNLASNPQQFLRDTAAELGLQLVPITQANQPPQGRPQAAPPQRASAPPPPDIQLQDGRWLRSDENQALRDAWLEEKIAERFSQELRPIQEERQQREEQAYLAKIESQQTEKAKEDIAELMQNEGFNELRPDILAIMKSDKRYTLEKAYARAYREKYQPTRDVKLRQTWADEQTQKARAANSSLSPTRRVTAENGSGEAPSIADILRQKAAEANVTF